MTVKRWIFRHHTAVDLRYFWQKIGVKFYPQWDIVAPSSPWILIKEILTSIAALYRLCDILPLWKISWKENGIPRSTYVFLGIFIKILTLFRWEEIKTSVGKKISSYTRSLLQFTFLFGSNPHANSALISSVFKVLGH